MKTVNSYSSTIHPLCHHGAVCQPWQSRGISIRDQYSSRLPQSVITPFAMTREIKTEKEFVEATREREDLLTHFNSVILSTVDDAGEPNASYAPAAVDENYNFYIYVSALARHSANLKATGKASLMIIEDESTAVALFARRRLTLEVKVSIIKWESKKWNTAFEILEKKFKNNVEMLKNLIDFDLFLLKPSEGTLVYGFGKAFRIYGKGLKQIGYVRSKGGHRRNLKGRRARNSEGQQTR